MVQDAHEQLVSLLTQAQKRLHAYIFTLLANADATQDVLQETNLVIWRKRDEYHRDMDFVGWACRIAYYQVLSYRRNRSRDRHLFSEALIENLAAMAEERSNRFDQRWHHLQHCLEQLPAHARTLIERRYTLGLSVNALAAQLGRSANTLAQTLCRLRKELLECVHRQIGKETL